MSPRRKKYYILSVKCCLMLTLLILSINYKLVYAQQIRVDVCAMTPEVLGEFLDCVIKDAPDGTKKKWEKTIQMFNGKTPVVGIGQLCKGAPTSGIAIINGFVNQQAKPDKPKLKKIIVECNK